MPSDEPSKQFFMHVPSQQQADDTHLQEPGAYAVACLVVAGWKQLDPGLAGHLVRDIDCGARPTALMDRAAQSQALAVVNKSTLSVRQPGPHGGAGTTTAYPFFAEAKSLDFAFRKRVLHPGADIGLHQHDKDEVYYVINGAGIYMLDGQTYAVGAEHALCPPASAAPMRSSTRARRTWCC